MARATKPPFQWVVDRHGPMVLRVCRAVVGPDEAEDAWSETFLAALRAYPNLDADANVEAWLVTIAHRKAIDLRRAGARRPVPTATSDLEATAPAADRTDRSGPVWRALRALPERQRHAIAYHHLAGLSYRDAARLMGGTEAAVRRAAADGLATLRRVLADTPDRGSP